MVPTEGGEEGRGVECPRPPPPRGLSLAGLPLPWAGKAVQDCGCLAQALPPPYSLHTTVLPNPVCCASLTGVR